MELKVGQKVRITKPNREKYNFTGFYLVDETLVGKIGKIQRISSCTKTFYNGETVDCKLYILEGLYHEFFDFELERVSPWKFV